MNEIEEFLKRAAAMRAQQKAGQGQRPGPQGAPAQRPPAGTQPANAPSGSAPPTARGPLVTNRPTAIAPLSQRSKLDVVLDAEVIEEEPVSGDDVADYVARHLDAGLFKERSSHLGESIKHSDEAIEARLHQTFEHRLGQLGPGTPRAEDSTLDEEEMAALRLAKAAARPADLRTLLQSPLHLRNAIILAEVLNPPTHRW